MMSRPPTLALSRPDHRPAQKLRRRALRRALPLLLAAGIVASTGCGSDAPVRLVGKAESQRIAQTATLQPQDDRDARMRLEVPPRKDVAFQSERAETSTSAQTKRHAALIGLYGELLNTPSAASGPFEGAGNLAQITSAAEGGCFDPDVDRTGTLIAYASTEHSHTADIFIRSIGGSTQRRITSDPAEDAMPAFSPDSRRIAFASNRSGNWDLYITTVSGGPPLKLTEDHDPELHPTWSPDGRRIAYCKLSSQSGQWEIWLVDVENPSRPQLLVEGIFPQWSPDPARSKIVFQRARERGSRLFSIWTIDYIAGEALHPTEIVSASNAAAMHPSWSPDGERIVFVTVLEPDRQPAGMPAQADVWVVNLDGTAKTNLTQSNSLNLYPTWAADGTVYFLSDRSGADNIWAVATSRTIDLAPSHGENDEEFVTANPEERRAGEYP